MIELLSQLSENTPHGLGVVDGLDNVGMNRYGDDDVLGVVLIESVEVVLPISAEGHAGYTLTVVVIRIKNIPKLFRSNNEQSHMRSIDPTQFIHSGLVELVSTVLYLNAPSPVRNIINASNRLIITILIPILHSHSNEMVWIGTAFEYKYEYYLNEMEE